jgi:predicted Zn-dependent protease
LALLLALELVVGQPGAQQSAAREGVRLARQVGDLDRAESILRSALSKDRSEMPSDHAAWVRIELANLCAERSRIEEALDLREQAIEFVAPEDRRALLLQLAQDAGGISDWKRAAQVYEGLLEREPADRELWQPLLEAYRKLGNTERLVSLIEQTIPLVESAKARARLRLEQAQVLLQQPGTESVAADLLKEILQDDPTHLEAAVMFSGVLEKLGRQHELTDLLAMQLDSAKDRQDIPSIVSITMRLGSLLEQQQRAGEALDLYRGALEWDRSCREMLSAVLRLAMNTGDRDLVADSMESLLKSETGAEASALAARLVALREELFDPPGAERALELGFDKNPADEPTREALLERYRTRSDHQAIARVLQRAIQARPGDHGLLERLVEAQRNAGEPEGALAIINDLIDKEPQNATLLRKRAVLHSELGRDRDALADLERIQLSKGERAEELVLALERAAKSSDSEVSRRATLRLADILESTGQVDSARERLSALIKQAPKDRDSLRKLADLETRAENWSAASTAFRKLLALVEGAALVDTALELAAVCRRADRPEDARAALERAVWVEPNRPGLREQLRELYELTGANRELAQLVLQDAAAEKEVSGRLQGLLRAGELLIGPDGDVNEAVKVLEEARGLSPESMDGIVLLARAYSAAGRSEEGLTLLNQTIEAHRGRRSKALLDVYQEVSRIQLAEGFLSDALSALSKAFDLDMKNFNLAMQVGRLAMEMREEEAATRAFRAVTMLRTDESGAPVPHTLRAEAHYQLALLAQNKGDSKRAKVLAVKALSEDPELEPAKVLLSQIEGT